MKGPDFSWTINFIVCFEYLSLPQHVIKIYIMYVPYTYPKILMIIKFLWITWIFEAPMGILSLKIQYT